MSTDTDTITRQDVADASDLPDWAIELVTGTVSGPTPTTPAQALTAAWLHDVYVHRDRTIAKTAELASDQFGFEVTEADIYEALDRHNITWRNGGTPTPGLTRALLVRRYLKDRWPLQKIADEIGVSREAVRKARDRFGIPRRRAGLAGRITKEELTELYVDEGLSVRQIASELNSSPSTVSRLLAEHDIRRRRVLSAEELVDVDEVVDRYSSGDSIRSIAADIDLTDTTVRNLLLRQGVQLRGKRRLHEEVSREQLAGLIDDGLEVADIAERLGCTPKSVYRLLDRYELDTPASRT